MVNCRMLKIPIVVQNLNYNEAGTVSNTKPLPGQFTAIRSIVDFIFFSPYISTAALFQSVETGENASR